MSVLEDTLSFHLKTLKSFVFMREYRFHVERRFRFDFALPELKIGIEVEGGVWIKGRHTRPQGFINDCEKYNLAAKEGWRVFRFTADMIKSGGALKLIEEVLGV